MKIGLKPQHLNLNERYLKFEYYLYSLARTVINTLEVFIISRLGMQSANKKQKFLKKIW